MTAGSFHGPLSPVGAALGVLLIATPLVLGVTDASVFAAGAAVGPVLGLLLLAAPGRPRHVGTGLVVSAMTYPLLLIVLVLLWTT